MSGPSFALVPFLIGLTPGFGLLAWGAVTLGQGPTKKSLDKWSARYGLTLTDTNLFLVVRYLRRTRGLRIVGAGLGWLASPVFVALTGQGIPLFGVSVLVAIVGYILGAVIAETAFARPFGAPSEVRLASLAPRVLLDYVPSVSIWSLRVLATITIGLALLFAGMPRHPEGPGDPSLALVIGVAVLLTGFALAVERILQRIVERPQPASDVDLVAADDAIRASSIHSVSGAGIGMLLVGIGAELFWMQFTTSVEPLRQLLGWPATVAILLALLSCAGLGHPRTWRVRHSADTQ
ncbi:MAG: hypothetical protein ACYDAL_15065 [Candidatus Dormibacteraceae bacterium]